MNIPLPRIYSIATFFKAFSLKPKGKYSIHVCMGTACHVKGADKIAEKFERELGIKEGDTTPDLMFSLHKVYCVGCCGLAPVVMVNEDVNAKVTIQKVPSIIKKYKK
jgi:NADH-quinone oxidoreductase subunit E